MLHRLSYKTLLSIVFFLLIAIVVLIRISQKPYPAAARWFDDGWQYRKSITVTNNTSTESNVYIQLTFNIGSTANAQSDDGDLRFTKVNGEVLPYYIVSGTGTTAVVVNVSLDSFPAGTQIIYGYYGNPSAPNGYSISNFSTQASNYTIGSLGSQEVGGGPVAYWKFDEGYGTTSKDSTQNNLNLSFNGTPTWQSEDQCISGKCLFSSGTAYLSKTDDDKLDFDTGSFTISFWGKPIDYTYPKSFFPMSKGSSCYTGANKGWCIDSYSATGINVSLNDGTNRVSSTLSFNSGNRPPDLKNKWTLITYVFDRTNNLIYAYINGVLQTNTVNIASVTGSISNSNLLYIGQSAGWGTHGYLDDIKIYPYARSALQIKTDYNSRGSIKGSSVNLGSNLIDQGSYLSNGLVGYWKMDENVGTTITDSSGTGYTGTFGAGASAPAFSTGKFGVGTSFSTNDYISIGSTISTVQTVSAWYYASDTAPKF